MLALLRVCVFVAFRMVMLLWFVVVVPCRALLLWFVVVVRFCFCCCCCVCVLGGVAIVSIVVIVVAYAMETLNHNEHVYDTQHCYN